MDKKNKRNLIIAVLLIGGAYLYIKRKKKREAMLRSQMMQGEEEVPQEEESLGGGGGGFGGGSVAGDVESEAGEGSDVDIATGGGVTGAGSILNVNLGDTTNTKPTIEKPNISVSDSKNPYIYGDKPIKPSKGGGLLSGIGKGIDAIGDAIGGGSKPPITNRPLGGTIKQVPYGRPVEKKPSVVASLKPSSSPSKAQIEAMQKKKLLEAKAKAMAGKINAVKKSVPMKKFAFADFDGDDMDFGLDMD